VETCVLDAEAGGDMFLQNNGRLSTDYTALYVRSTLSLKHSFINVYFVGVVLTVNKKTLTW
jgi:hypothetical protein